jgi:hypothetical protein
VSARVARRLPVVGVVNGGKAQTLSLMGEELDRVRRGVWFRFAGVKSAALSRRQIDRAGTVENCPTTTQVTTGKAVV